MGMSNDGKTILYLHPVEVRYLDYGYYLETVHRCTWSSDGEPTRKYLENVTFEAKWADVQASNPASAGVEVRRGKTLRYSIDMNPHGFI